MKVQYHLTPAQIQETVVLIEADKRGEVIPSSILCFADFKFYGDLDRDTFVELPNISLVGFFHDIRDFLKSDKAGTTIYGWFDYHYSRPLHAAQDILADYKCRPQGEYQNQASHSRNYVQSAPSLFAGLLRYVPQLASYPGLDWWEKDFNFKIRR